MSEAQRRYLLRILAGQGIAGDAAHEYLKGLFAADSLTDVGKNDATAMIDRLLAGSRRFRSMEPLSVSRVQTYLGCPLKYRFQYIDHIPRPWREAALVFWTSVHAGVEWFEKERLAGKEPQPSAVLAQFDADWYAANVEPLAFSDKDSQESLREKGHELLRLYVEQVNGKRPVAV